MSMAQSATVHAGKTGLYLSLVVYSILIATSFPVGEAVSQIMSPIVLTCLRFAVAALIFLGIVVARREFRVPSRELLLKSGILALSMAVFMSLMFVALQTASALNTGAIFTLSPLFSLIIGFFLSRVGTTALQLAALLIGAIGAVWIVFDGNLDLMLAFRLGRGEQLFLLGTICFSFFNPLAKRLVSGESIAVVTFWVLVWAAVFTGLASLAAVRSFPVGTLSEVSLAAILYLAAFPTAVTFFIATRASTIIAPYKVTSFVYLVPAAVAVIDIALFGRAIPVTVWFGIAVTAAATLIVQFDNVR